MVNEKRKEQLRLYREKNIEVIRLQKQKYYQENKEEILNKAKEYRDNNKEKKYKYMQKYYKENKEDLLKKNKLYRDKPEVKEKIKSNDKKRQQTPKRQKQDRDRNKKPKRKAYKKKYFRRYQRRRRKDDEEFRLIHNMRTHFCKAMDLYSNNGKIMNSKKYGIYFKAIIKYLGPKPQDGNTYEADHVIPLSLFNHNDKEQVKKAWSPENFQWLTREINQWKGNRLIKPLSNEQKIKLQAKLIKHK